MTAAPLLQMEALTREYRTPGGAPLRALDQVSLAVKAGEILGVVGESGSGKSTLARLAAVLDRPSAGRVRLNGEDLSSLSPQALRERRRHFQMVFQDPFGSLDPRWRVGRIVAEPLGLTGASRAEKQTLVTSVLEAVGLDRDDARRFPHVFSGGQRQRIALARALVTNPQLVIADEPVSALDLSVQAQVLNLLRELRARRTVAFLFITHDLAVAEAICDTVAVLYAGRVVERGPADAVLRAPRHPYARRLVASAALQPRAAPADTAAHRPFADDPVNWHGCAFRARCERASDICRRETPLERDVAGGFGHGVACHHPLEEADVAMLDKESPPASS